MGKKEKQQPQNMTDEETNIDIDSLLEHATSEFDEKVEINKMQQQQPKGDQRKEEDENNRDNSRKKKLHEDIASWSKKLLASGF